MSSAGQSVFNYKRFFSLLYYTSILFLMFESLSVLIQLCYHIGGMLLGGKIPILL